MPVTVSYPGIYIEELPSNNFTITPAPTSVAVFIGYTHPFKTKDFDKAVQVFNFTEFERAFGGYLASGVFDGNVALAVRQFYLNGGSNAYVVGLKPQYNVAGSATDAVTAADTGVAEITTARMNPSVDFTSGGVSLTVYGLEPTDQLPMEVSFIPKAGTPTKADVRVTYGSQVEMLRDVEMTDASIKSKVNERSQLIRIRQKGAAWPADFAFANLTQPLSMTVPAGANTFLASQFETVLLPEQDLDKVEVFNLMVLPGVTVKSILDTALAYCERKLAFLIMDPPVSVAADAGAEIKTAMEAGNIAKHVNGAIYFPHLVATHPVTQGRVELPPSGTVAGVYARTDTQFGVWKAPAGIETGVRGVKGVVENGRLTDMRHGLLNDLGINALRNFPGIGTVVYGARTLEAKNPAHEQWRYVPVRRMALFIEQTLKANLTWVVFRPNDEPLWAAIRASITGFMMSLFRQAAFKGDSPSKAFQVKCDSETTTETDINLGIVNIVVAFAPLKPAEFVIVKIAQLAGQAES
jgi:uncharacterized protein